MSPDVTFPGFPDIAYLDWIVGRPAQAEYDLGSSDLRRAQDDPISDEAAPPTSNGAAPPTSDEAASPATGEVVPPALADVPTPEATVEEQLADLYDVAPENVLVTAGATQANFLAVAAALREASEESAARVLVEKPGYEPLLATPRGLGATVDRFRRPESKEYALDLDALAAELTEDAVVVTVTNRHNPSGRRAGRAELAGAAEVVADANADARLLVDEVYAPFDGERCGDAETTGPFGGPTAAGLPNAVVTNSLTKFLGFPGVRLGWLVADEAFVAHARKVKHHVPAVAEPSRLLARRALARAPALAADSRERIRANHDALAGFVADLEDLSGRVESGCTYAFLEHELADGDEVARAAWEQGILVVPGRFFDDPDRFRIAACRAPETVRASLDRLTDVLDSLNDS